jgi:hypothetical protein
MYELVKLWKQAVAAYIDGNYTGICLDEVSKTMKNISHES